MILPGLRSLAELEALGERLLSAVAQPTLLGETLCVAVSTSIGFRLVPPDDADPDTLLRQADQAMYAAKRDGPGRMHHFDVELERRQLLQRSRLEQVRQAIDGQQLRLFVQPVIELATQQLRFAEALVRWQHPQQGLLPPQAWLGWIEHQPEIIRLGDWVLEQALHHCSAWVRAGQCAAVSVNMSARELRDPGFSERIRSALARHPDLPASALRLEVLETAALEDLEQVAQSIARCRELGVSFALDDFGTGYSSLTYLRRLPISTIKIDRSFVARMLVDPADQAIVRAVVDLAHAFGRTCVAEGVEKPEHLQALRAMGCELAQGFAIARPMPAEDLPGWCSQFEISWLVSPTRAPHCSRPRPLQANEHQLVQLSWDASRSRTDSAWLCRPSLSARVITAGPVASRAARLNWIREVWRRKVSTLRAPAKRAVPLVGRVWLGPAR